MVVITGTGFIHEGFDLVAWHACLARGALAATEDKKGVAVLSRQLHMDVRIFYRRSLLFDADADITGVTVAFRIDVKRFALRRGDFDGLDDAVS